ncbi:MAG: DUF1002 domain-containing protein [Lachnospiraceae bacterium]|nr:DUF1002 domain-containing protein [Lachnospiraceae bacterium]
MNVKKNAVLLLSVLLAALLSACGDRADLYDVNTDPREYKDQAAEELSENDAEQPEEENDKSGGSRKSGKAGTGKWAGKSDDGKPENEKEPDSTESVKTPEMPGSSKNYVALGKNLTDEQLATVLSLMEISGEDLEESDVVYVTNEEEHAFLDSYIDPAKIGKNALSSVLVKPAEKGHGVDVTTKNINYCTPEMYKNAFMTAGVNDAEIIVAGPFDISGTAALIGAVKAYERVSGVQISDDVVDAAVDELITTGDIADKLNSKDDAAKLIALIKKEIITKNPGSKAEIEEIVRQALKDLGLTLSDEYIDRIVELIMKIIRALAMQKLAG